MSIVLKFTVNVLVFQKLFAMAMPTAFCECSLHKCNEKEGTIKIIEK